MEPTHTDYQEKEKLQFLTAFVPLATLFPLSIPCLDCTGFALITVNNGSLLSPK